MRARTVVPAIVAALASGAITWAAASHPAPPATPPTHTAGWEWPVQSVTVTATVTATPSVWTVVTADARHWSDGVAVCLSEDGSTPGQEFPCRWEAANLGNGQGDDYTLTAAPQ